MTSLFSTRTCAALALGLAISTAALAIEPFADLPDLEALPELDRAPPKLLPPEAESLAMPVNRDGSPVHTAPAGSGAANAGGATNSPGSAGGNSATSATPGSMPAANSAAGSGFNTGPGQNSAQPASSGSNSSSSADLNSSLHDGTNSGSDAGLNSESDAGTNSESSAGSNSDSNSGSNSGSNSDSNSGSNSGSNSHSNSGSNSSASPGANSDTDPGSAHGANPGGNGNTGGGHASQGANSNHPYLTPLDASMAPVHNPPGTPLMPSQCAENAGCRPCFEQANDGLDAQRRNLEKVRAVYDYTHKFTREGTELLYAAGAAGGGIAHMGAVEEVRKVEGALDEFDATVRRKNAELLGKLQASLQDLARCEVEYFDNEDWYLRYGEVYYQFMQARYSF